MPDEYVATIAELNQLKRDRMHDKLQRIGFRCYSIRLARMPGTPVLLRMVTWLRS
jgi:hypothetical protein